MISTVHFVRGGKKQEDKRRKYIPSNKYILSNTLFVGVFFISLSFKFFPQHTNNFSSSSSFPSLYNNNNNNNKLMFMSF